MGCLPPGRFSLLWEVDTDNPVSERCTIAASPWLNTPQGRVLFCGLRRRGVQNQTRSCEVRLAKSEAVQGWRWYQLLLKRVSQKPNRRCKLHIPGVPPLWGSCGTTCSESEQRAGFSRFVGESGRSRPVGKRFASTNHVSFATPSDETGDPSLSGAQGPGPRRRGSPHVRDVDPQEDEQRGAVGEHRKDGRFSPPDTP